MLLKEDMVMRLMDFAPLSRSSIGFDRMFNMIENAAQPDQAEAYPPYNVERTGQDSYRITLAVAGFKLEDLEITSQPNLLIVAGNKSVAAKGEVLYQGIPSRPFHRRFNLADFVKVTDANLHDGMLTIDLAREVPEPLQPRRIEIANPDQKPTMVRPAA